MTGHGKLRSDWNMALLEVQHGSCMCIDVGGQLLCPSMWVITWGTCACAVLVYFLFKSYHMLEMLVFGYMFCGSSLRQLLNAFSPARQYSFSPSHVVQDLVAPLYAHLIAEAAQRLGPNADFFALWPKVEPPMPWGAVAQQFYQQVSQLLQ